MIRKIVGSGLGGLSAGVVLSNNDTKIEMFERAPNLGEYRGQDFQVIRSYGSDANILSDLSNMGIKIKFTNPITKIVKYAPSGKSMEITSNNGPLFHVVKRGRSPMSLDYQLFNQLDTRNATVNFGRNVNVLSGDIVATGPIIRNLAGFGYTYEGISIDKESILFFMDNRYAPNGYIYVSPYGNDSASIGVVSFDMNINLKILLDKFIEDNEIVNQFFKKDTRRETFSGFAHCNYPETANINGKMFVGAAAGFVEAARGFGVKYSLLSGCMAAKSILENKNYDSLWKESFGDDLKENLYRHFVLEKLDNNGLEKLILNEKVKVNEYKKVPDTLSKVFKKVALGGSLKDWQKQYSLSKIFK